MSGTAKRYSDVKAGALGTLPGRLLDLVSRTTDENDVSLLLSIADRLDALAGDFAYNYMVRKVDDL